MSLSETGSYNAPDAREVQRSSAKNDSLRKHPVFSAQVSSFSGDETKHLSRKNRMLLQARQMKAK